MPLATQVEFSSTYRNVGSAEMLFYNGLLALPPLAVMVVVTGEYRIIGPAFISATLASPSFPALLAMCSVLGTLLNLSLFLCTINNSALTTTVVGVLKGVLVTVLGFFLLGGVEFHPLNVLGIGLNTIGGVCYAAIKYRQKQRYTASGNRLKPESAVQVQIDSTSFSAQSAPMNPLVQRGSGLNADVHVSAARERFIHPWMEI